jgi:hypothetical protein
MNTRRFQPIIIALIASIHCVSGQDVRSERNNVSKRNWHNFLQYVAPALKSTGSVGRLYYHSDCWTERGDGILFPGLKLVAPAKSKTGLAAIQDIFRNEKQVTITEGRFGICRISMGSVSYELLRTKIRMLTLTSRQRYNIQDAIWAIEQTKEVEGKVRELKLEYPPTVFSGSVLEPAPDLPHLPVSLKDVTMDEALDRVAQTFGVLVKYGECASGNGTRLIFVDFDYIR